MNPFFILFSLFIALSTRIAVAYETDGDQIVHKCGYTYDLQLCGLRQFSDGGEEFDIVTGEYPWYVSLRSSDGDKRKVTCGASLVASTHAVTSAHCCVRANDAVAGVISTQDLLADTPQAPAQVSKVKACTPHPKYNTSAAYRDSYLYDVAVVEFERPFEFAKNEQGAIVVNSICLPHERDAVYRATLAVVDTTKNGNNHE